MICWPGLGSSGLWCSAPHRTAGSVVDEVQRIPSLLNEVHRLIEEGRRVALLGSSARKLRAAGVNLLAGRALWRQMFPLLPEELGADFNVDEELRHGSIALVRTAEDRRGVLETCVRLYLSEEIRAESNVRNLPGFLRFLPVAARLHGQQINVAGGSPATPPSRGPRSRGYLEVLEDTLVAWRLPAFEAKLRVREQRRPKLYWVDPGLVRAARRQLGPVGNEERGPLFEGWVLGLLRAYREEGPLYDDLRYWAAAGSRIEVDALLLRGREAARHRGEGGATVPHLPASRPAGGGGPAGPRPPHPCLPPAGIGSEPPAASKSGRSATSYEPSKQTPSGPEGYRRPRCSPSGRDQSAGFDSFHSRIRSCSPSFLRDSFVGRAIQPSILATASHPTGMRSVSRSSSRGSRHSSSHVMSATSAEAKASSLSSFLMNATGASPPDSHSGSSLNMHSRTHPAFL